MVEARYWRRPPSSPPDASRLTLNDHGRVDAPEVTVILCTYNRARLLEDTLAALTLQHTPSSLTWELLVVDNNSTDDTRAVVETFARTAPMPVRYLYEPIQGKSHALNTGVAVARGDRKSVV